jgi:hypothetical protein
MTHIVLRIDRVVLDTATATGRPRAELVENFVDALRHELTAGLQPDRGSLDVPTDARHGRSVHGIAVTAPDTSLGAVAAAVTNGIRQATTHRAPPPPAPGSAPSGGAAR